MTQSSEHSPFSVGIERVLVRAALDPAFRAQLLDHRDELLASGEVGLGASEARLLRSIPAAQMTLAIERAAVPNASRRGFIRAVPATLVAALAAPHLAGCIGDADGDVRDASLSQNDFHSCDGNRPDVVPSCSATEPGGDYWINLSGHTAFLHLPEEYSPGVPRALCLAFHDANQSCLDMVQDWRDVTDSLDATLVALDWSGRREDASDLAVQIESVIDELASRYCVQSSYALATGLGTGATVALDAALFRCDPIHYAIARTGATPQPCEPSRLLDPHLRRIHLTVRTKDPAYDQTKLDVKALRRAGVHVDLVELTNGVQLQTLDPLAIWMQLING